MERIRKILVVSRSTQECRKALNYGITLAQKIDAEVCVLQIFYNAMGLQGWNLPISGQMLEEEYQKIREDTKREMELIISKAREKDLKIQVVMREGKPVKEVLKVVEDEIVDLIVLAAHTEGRFEHFLFGRDNEEILRKLPSSVLFVKDEPPAVGEKI
jgi:nucleotide-binding universal stress UspA family protein